MARFSIPTVFQSSRRQALAGLCVLLLATGGVTAKEPPKTSAKPAAAATRPIDRNEVLSLYMSGEFETLVALLENIRHERQLRDREDSVFIFKFLGVIYGADDHTKRKAESFLYKMLELDPNQDLSSLGVGDSVEAIFERVRSHFAKLGADTGSARSRPAQPATPVAAASGVKAAEPAAPAPSAGSATPVSAAEPVATSDRKRVPTWMWAAGGGAAAAVVVGFLVLNHQPDPHVHAISDTLR